MPASCPNIDRFNAPLEAFNTDPPRVWHVEVLRCHTLLPATAQPTVMSHGQLYDFFLGFLIVSTTDVRLCFLALATGMNLPLIALLPIFVVLPFFAIFATFQ